MSPDQNYSPNQQPQPSNYGFIMDPPKPKPQLNNFFNGSPKSLIVMIGGGVGLLIVLFIIYQVAKPAGIMPQLSNLAHTQAEIVHLASLANSSGTGAQGQSAKNLAASLGVVAASQQSQLSALIAKSGDKFPSEALVVSASSADSKLATASQNSDFDSTFVGLATDNLKTYQEQLQKVYGETTGQNLRSQLNDDYNSTKLLLTQASAVH